ncbi:MAG: hypothetical protein QHH01_03405 [Spirochaetales bacterium]|nr:hypothetical protein [Spirochaetales bacterium]
MNPHTQSEPSLFTIRVVVVTNCNAYDFQFEITAQKLAAVRTTSIPLTSMITILLERFNDIAPAGLPWMIVVILPSHASHLP